MKAKQSTKTPEERERCHAFLLCVRENEEGIQIKHAAEATIQKVE